MKFSIVTPVLNGEKYIVRAIESVISQAGDFSIEYIIADGLSNDNTLSIVMDYKNKVAAGIFPIKCNGIEIKIISEKDSGMYSAINKGFALATGDIFAWINYDDFYLPNAFTTMSTAFLRFADAQWIKGITYIADKAANITKKLPCYLYNQNWIKNGVYGREAFFIQQDSVFWRSNLWQKIGTIDETYKLAGDYYLWIEFAKIAPLYSINTPVSCFRKITDQKSSDTKRYQQEQKMISRKKNNLRLKIFFWLFHNQIFKKINLYKFIFFILFGKKDHYLINIEENFKLNIKHYCLYE